MDDDIIRALMVRGLTIMRTGGEIAAAATGEIQDEVRHPGLAAALEEGHRSTRRWAQRVDHALRTVGGGEERRNPIIEAHYEAGRRIRELAPDDPSRDLAIIANGQLSLHYWIASFGTVRAYAERLGLSDVAAAMRDSAEDAERMVEANARNARAIMGA